jgi:hypothetical protein
LVPGFGIIFGLFFRARAIFSGLGRRGQFIKAFKEMVSPDGDTAQRG